MAILYHKRLGFVKSFLLHGQFVQAYLYVK